MSRVAQRCGLLLVALISVGSVSVAVAFLEADIRALRTSLREAERVPATVQKTTTRSTGRGGRVYTVAFEGNAAIVAICKTSWRSLQPGDEVLVLRAHRSTPATLVRDVPCKIRDLRRTQTILAALASAMLVVCAIASSGGKPGRKP